MDEGATKFPDWMIEAEIQRDLKAYSEAGEDIHNFFGLMLNKTEQGIRHYDKKAKDARSTSDKTLFHQYQAITEFMRLKKDSLWEAWFKLLYGKVNLKKVLDGPYDERFVATVLNANRVYQYFINSRTNLGEIEWNPNPEFMGYKLEVFLGLVHEAQCHVRDWALNPSRIDSLIELGRELEKMNKLPRGTQLKRTYFVVMYWGYFVKKYRKSSARTFDEFMHNEFLRPPILDKRKRVWTCSFCGRVICSDDSLKNPNGAVGKNCMNPDCLSKKSMQFNLILNISTFRSWYSKIGLRLNQPSLPSCELWQ